MAKIELMQHVSSGIPPVNVFIDRVCIGTFIPNDESSIPSLMKALDMLGVNETEFIENKEESFTCMRCGLSITKCECYRKKKGRP